MEQFKNTFENGMNKDFNVLLQPQGTYRNMVNCSLISQDGNNYVVKDCIGNILTFTINVPYNGTTASNAALPMPIGFISLPNRLIVFSTNYEGTSPETGGYLEIGEIKYLPYGEGIQPLAVSGNYNNGYVPLYHHAGLNGNKRHRIEGFGIQENELIQRIYWSDNFQPPRTLNISDSVLTTYISSGDIGAIGKKYMVLEGAIQYPVGALNPIYGPGLTAGNVFTSDGTATYTILTGTSPTPKVIEYIPFELLDWTPDRYLGNIDFVEYGTGTVYCGSKIYFYRYGLNSDYQTPWSYGSAPIHITVQNDTAFTTSNPYVDMVGGGTISTLLASPWSVKVKIDNIDTRYDYIQLACAEYDQLIEVPRLVSVVAQMGISVTDTSIELEHTGGENLGTLTIDDISLFPADILKCKTLDTNKNYILTGNITERAELNLDFTGSNKPTITGVQYLLPELIDVDNLNYLQPINQGEVGNANPSTICIDSKWLVTDVSGGDVTYNGNTYTLGEYFTGVITVYSVTIPAGSQIRPCIVIPQYTATAGAGIGTVREKIIQLKNNDNFWDYKDPQIHQHLAGYWSNEKYRIGVLFYDKKGNPYYVRWLDDITFDTITDKGGLMLEYIDGANTFYSINATGLKIDGLKIPKSEIDNIDGFSIVRAPRDARIICQGLVTQCVNDVAIIKPASYIPLTYSDYLPPTYGVYSFLSPDINSGVPLKSTIGVVGDTMESAGWLDPIDFGATDYVGIITASVEEAVSRIIRPLTADTNLRTKTITGWVNVVENESSSINTFPITNEMKIGGAGSPTGLDGYEAIGGKKVIFQLDSDFDHYNVGTGYTDNANNNLQEKILMNYVKSNVTNQYGGTGEFALANTVYISTGHYQKITDDVKTDTDVVGDYYVFDNINVWGGDCYICMIDYGYGLWNKDFANKYSYAWSFPVECNSNYNLRRGRKQSNSGMYFTGSTAPQSLVYLSPTSDVRLESYQYNQGYSTEGESFKYPALPFNFINANSFVTRVRYAGPKFIGEINDAFRTFLVNDYKDLDVQKGQIMSLKVKDDRVFVWQVDGLSTVPVLERQILSNVPGAVTTLGTGGVVDRYDTIDSYFGTQHQWSVIPTEYGFVYFDMRHKAFVSVDSGVQEVSFIGGLEGYFNEAFNEVGRQASIINSNLILNSPTFDATSDMPCIGVGIIGVYDPKFKYTYMTFKFYNQLTAAGVDRLLNRDFTVIYYHPKKQFIGFNNGFLPAIAHNHNAFVIAANNPKNITRYYGPNMALIVFQIGDVVDGEDNSEYVCIQAVAINSYPGSVGQEPSYPGSVYWTKINYTNELWVNNQPKLLGQITPPDYQYNKFFGRVVNNEIEFVINPNSTNPFSVTNIEQEGNPINVTDVYISASSQSANDLSITSTNKWYRRIYDKICSSLPLSSTGRITDSYLTVRLVKKNWTTNPTVYSGIPKILRSIYSYFEIKR